MNIIKTRFVSKETLRLNSSKFYVENYCRTDIDKTYYNKRRKVMDFTTVSRNYSDNYNSDNEYFIRQLKFKAKNKLKRTILLDKLYLK